MSRRPIPTAVMIVCVVLLAMKGLPLLVTVRGYAMDALAAHSLLPQPGAFSGHPFAPRWGWTLVPLGLLPGLIAAVAMLRRRNWGRLLYLVETPLGTIAGWLHTRGATNLPIGRGLLLAGALVIPMVVYGIFAYLLTRMESNAYFASIPPSSDAPLVGE